MKKRMHKTLESTKFKGCPIVAVAAKPGGQEVFKYKNRKSSLTETSFILYLLSIYYVCFILCEKHWRLLQTCP